MIETSKMSKEEKIGMLLDYAKECYKNGHKPTKKEIRRQFHLEIYNYFDNIKDYHEKAGISISLRNYSKDKAKKLIVDYLHSQVKKGHYLNRKEIEKELRIHLSTYFKDLKELYDFAGIDYRLIEKAIKDKILSAHTYSKDTLHKQREFIKQFILDSVSKNFYPSVPCIQKKLNLSFYSLYDNIFEAYEDAGIDYERPSPILLGKKKERLFTSIVKELLVKMGFIIKRVSIESDVGFNRSADMTIMDKKGDLCLVEIKAYREDYYVSNREFQQLLRYLKEHKVSCGIFVTTANIRRGDFDNIRIIDGEKIIEFLKLYGLRDYVEIIKWIQESRMNSKEREEYKDTTKNKIIDYIRIKGTMPTKKEIEKNLRIDIRSVFGRPNPYQKLIKEIEKLGPLSPRV